MRIGVVISSCGGLSPTHTTAHLLAAALAAGWGVRVVEAQDFDVDERGRIQIRAAVLDGLEADRDVIVDRLRARNLPRRQVDATTFDVVVLRVSTLDPALVAMAQAMAERGVCVLSDPAGLVLTSHKSWLAGLPSGVPRPRTLVTRSFATAEAFLAALAGPAVLKPARSSGGRGVRFLERGAGGEAAASAFAAAAGRGDGHVVVQAYIPEAVNGEKRLLWLEGEILGGYLRTSAPGDFRHNLRVGATPSPCTVDESDRAALHALDPHLRRLGTWLAGIDIIGGRIVEVNVLNPGGAHFTSCLAGVAVGEALVASLRRRAYSRRFPVPVPAK